MKNFYKTLDLKFKVICFSSIISLILAHGMVLFNKYALHDNVGIGNFVGYKVEIGRWGLEVLERLSKLFFGLNDGPGVYSLNLEDAIYTVIFLAIAVCLIVKLLNIKNILFCLLFSALFICSPFLCFMLGYNASNPYYPFCLLLFVGGIYIICTYKKLLSRFLGVLFLIFSLSIYQGFFPFAITLMLLFFIKKTIEDTTTFKDFLRNGIYYATVCIVSLIIYLITVKISLYITNTALTDYSNASGVLSLENLPEQILKYLANIKKAYIRFLKPELNFPLHSIYLYAVTLCLGIGLMIYKGFLLSKQSKMKACRFILLSCCLPLFINFPYVLGHDVHHLHICSQFLWFIYVVLLLESIDINKLKPYGITKNIFLVTMLCLILMFCRTSNIFYLKAEFAQTRAINYFTTMVAQIKNTKDYKDEYPVVYINEFNKEDKNIVRLYFMKFVIPPYYDTRVLINDYVWKAFMESWIAYSPTLGNVEDFQDLPEVKAMPHYPDYGSIKVINKTVVVKF